MNIILPGSIGQPAAAVQARGENMPRVTLNTPAPDFTLPDFHGQSFRLSDLAGKSKVLLVFNRGFI